MYLRVHICQCLFVVQIYGDGYHARTRNRRTRAPAVRRVHTRMPKVGTAALVQEIGDPEKVIQRSAGVSYPERLRHRESRQTLP